MKFSEFEQEAPFPIARIKPLKTRAQIERRDRRPRRQGAGVLHRLKESGRELPEKIDRYLSEMSDPEMLADLIASTFISDAARRQQLLEELDLNQRLRLLIQFLREEGGARLA